MNPHKPFNIAAHPQTQGLYLVRVNGPALQAFGAKRLKGTKSLPDGWLFRPSNGPWEVHIECRTGLTPDNAVSLCHYIGRYWFGLGDLVYAPDLTCRGCGELCLSMCCKHCENASPAHDWHPADNG
jgi:hypothetical protein